jgi:3-deoxy-D-manno-octulosonate 8-phosphate phosphatase (KDO 8-P phosphatase)
MALVRDSKLPFVFAWITGRSSEAVSSGAADLGISHVIQRCSDKKRALLEIIQSRQLSLNEVAFIGDDLIDIPLLKAVGLSACPADAVPDVRKLVHYVSPLNGGRGVGRDVLELILRAQKKWDLLLTPFLQ